MTPPVPGTQWWNGVGLPLESLFDRGLDPGETTNLAARQRQRLAPLVRLLQERQAQNVALRRRLGAAPAADTAREAGEALRALGYVGPAKPEPAALRQQPFGTGRPRRTKSPHGSLAGTECLPMPAGELTQLLRAWSDGDAGARARLIELVYAQLRALAQAQLRREHGARTLSATGLVHEVYLRLCGQEGLAFHDRAHFYGIAAVTMRRVLVEAARRRGSQKRGGDWRRVTLGAEIGALEARGVDLLDLDRALTALGTIDERQARIVELRFFAELSVEETAEALALSPATIKREWSLARAWLFRQLDRERAAEPDAC